MDASRSGARIFYTDIAVEMVGSPLRLFELADQQDVTTFRIDTGHTQREYTKRDAFVLMGADREEYWDDEMTHGAFSIFRNNEAARRLVREWKSYLRDPRILTDQANTQDLPNLPGFRAHRHDQSALSIIATRNRLPMYPDPSKYRGRKQSSQLSKPSPRFVARDFGQVFYHHRERDRPLLRRMARRLAKRVGRLGQSIGAWS